MRGIFSSADEAECSHCQILLKHNKNTDPRWDICTTVFVCPPSLRLSLCIYVHQHQYLLEMLSH